MTQKPPARHRRGGISLEAVAHLLRSGAMSASELLSRCLDEISERDGDIHAFVHLDAEGSCRHAERAAAAAVRKTDIGPLAGIPFACKDTIDVAGMPTSYGSAAVPPRLPSRNAEAVEALTDAGALCIGKLATTEFAAGDYLEPAPRNPWNVLHGAGGSSGGSAAAVAAGFVPLTVAADTGGSARIPASFCGVSALRPGRAAGTTGGIAPLTPSLDQVGWIAMEPTDLLMLWTLLNPSDSLSLDPRGRDAPYRVAAVSPWADVQDDVSAAASQLVTALPHSGIVTSNVVLEHGRQAAAAAWIITYAEAARIYGPMVRRHRMDLTPSLVRKIDGARYFDERDRDRARDIARRFRAEVDEALATADALLLPTVPMTAPSVTDSSYRSDVAIFTRPISLTDSASLSIPAGLGDAGLPVGVQLVGSGAQTAQLLALAAVMQRQGLVGQSTLMNVGEPVPTGAPPGDSSEGTSDGGQAAARAEAERVREDLWDESGRVG